MLNGLPRIVQEQHAVPIQQRRPRQLLRSLAAAFAGLGLIQARGYRLNIASSTAVRFEPGQTREVELVAYVGDRRVYGFNAKVMGQL